MIISSNCILSRFFTNENTSFRKKNSTHSKDGIRDLFCAIKYGRKGILFPSRTLSLAVDEQAAIVIIGKL